MGCLLAPDTAVVGQLGEVTTRAEALETKATKRQVPFDPEVRRLAGRGHRERFTGLACGGHFEAAIVRADAQSTSLAAAP